jgi:hypothetical protein
MSNIIYQSVSTEWVSKSPETCNTNNHFIENFPIEQYDELIRKTYKSEWVKYFPDPPSTGTLELKPMELAYLREACLVGTVKGTIPAALREDLETIDAKITFHFKNNPSIKKWFVRTSSCSPKDGVNGCGPFESSKPDASFKIIESLATSLRVYLGLKKDGDHTIYLVPWRDDWDTSKEFRVYVYKRKITAISQYAWHTDVLLTELKLKQIIPKIIDFCHDAISKVPFEDCTIDVAALSTGTGTDFVVELVEFNCFGKNLAAGSCCFHWLNDETIMYSDGLNIVVRYVSG